MFSKKLFFKLSLMLNVYCGILRYIPPNHQRRPLPSLLYLSFFFDIGFDIIGPFQLLSNTTYNVMVNNIIHVNILQPSVHWPHKHCTLYCTLYSLHSQHVLSHICSCQSTVQTNKIVPGETKCIVSYYRRIIIMQKLTQLS